MRGSLSSSTKRSSSSTQRILPSITTRMKNAKLTRNHNNFKKRMCINNDQFTNDPSPKRQRQNNNI